jgi:predicted site-specific integrase-resolvase
MPSLRVAIYARVSSDQQTQAQPIAKSNHTRVAQKRTP